MIEGNPMLEQNRFEILLGKTAIALWSELPQTIQEQIFERAVLLGHQTERDEMLREELGSVLGAPGLEHGNGGIKIRHPDRLSI